MLKPVLRVSAAYVGAVCFFYLTEMVLLGVGWHLSPVVAWVVAVIGWVAALTVVVWASGVRSLRATGMTNLRRWVRWVAVAVMTVATVARGGVHAVYRSHGDRRIDRSPSRVTAAPANGAWDNTSTQRPCGTVMTAIRQAV